MLNALYSLMQKSTVNMITSSHNERGKVGEMASVPCIECLVTSALLVFVSPCAPRRNYPRLQSDGECQVEPKRRLQLLPMMPMLTFPQSPSTACHTQPTTMLVSSTSYSDVIRVPFVPL